MTKIGVLHDTDAMSKENHYMVILFYNFSASKTNIWSRASDCALKRHLTLSPCMYVTLKKMVKIFVLHDHMIPVQSYKAWYDYFTS